MSILKTKLEQILSEKNKLTPDKLKAGFTIFGIEGVLNTGDSDATSDAILESKYLLSGYSMVSNGILINGTMPNNGTKTIRYSNNDQIIPHGYYDLLTIQAAIASELDGYNECKEALEYLGGVV